MILDLIKFNNMLKAHNINIIYSGPMWEDGIKSIADVVENRLALEDISANAAKAVFSVFVEQVTNILMYSAKKESFPSPEKETLEVAVGSLLLGITDTKYFIQTANVVNNESIEHLKQRIDYVNSLDKKELRKFHREQLHNDNDNPESKGAGLGIIEIARRATSPLLYTFEPLGNDTSSFTMYAEIAHD